MVRVMKALVACAAFGAGAGPFFISPARADDYADVAGLVYIRDHTTGYFEPAEDATVKLWKRSEAMPSKWLLYADDATVAEDGYYLYDDVKMTGDDSLCQEYDWFKIEISGPDLKDTVFTRFAHRAPRNGVVRVDVILYVGEPAETPPEGEVEYFHEHGHFTYKDANNVFVWGKSIWSQSEATCPPGENLINFGGCIDADWTIWYISEDWGSVGPGYARYDFYDFDPPHTFFGRGYYYWDAACPLWGMHEDVSREPGFIWVDFYRYGFPALAG